jgi:hypothetical protein
MTGAPRSEAPRPAPCARLRSGRDQLATTALRCLDVPPASRRPLATSAIDLPPSLGHAQSQPQLAAMSSAHQMFWVRILDALAARGAEPSVIEAEVAAEVLIPGMLTYADHAIVFGPTTFAPDASGLYKYLLRVKSPTPGEPIAFDTVLKTSSRGGYLLPGAPVTELVALFSLALQARLFVLATVERPLDPQYLPRKTDCDVLRATGDLGHQDGLLFSSLEDRNIVSLPPLLDAIRRIPAKHHLELAVAADHYARAVRTIGLDAEMVFVRLVSAIERVMPEHPSDSLSEKLLALEGLSDAEREELKVTLQARRARVRFVAFLDRYSKGFFDGEPKEPAHTQVTPENLPDVATAIYRARSGYLHGGDPMYVSRRMGQFPAWHMEPTVGKWEQNRAFTAAQKLPTTEFFHRLVRHCILARIEELAKTDTPAADADESTSPSTSNDDATDGGLDAR